MLGIWINTSSIHLQDRFLCLERTLWLTRDVISGRKSSLLPFWLILRSILTGSLIWLVHCFPRLFRIAIRITGPPIVSYFMECLGIPRSAIPDLFRP